MSRPLSGLPRVLALVAAGALVLAAIGHVGVTLWQRAKPQQVGPVRISAQPQTIWIEAGDTAQSLNVDFLVENQGSTALGIDGIELVATDASGRTVLRRFIDSNGFAPSIETVPGRIVAAGGRLLVFNPFHTFRPDVELHKLAFTFKLSIPNEAPETEASVTIEPRVYRSRTPLSLPVRGRLLIHDGHDFYAHHRRLNTEHPIARGLGIARNFMRYSLDINPTDAQFAPFRGNGARNEDWAAWGQPVFAPGDGTVVGAEGGEPDNLRGGQNFFKPERVKTSPMTFYGNHLVIDHGNGEFSLLGHLQKGSLAVKTGDRVVRGQPVARIGSSGSSNNPHLHYELRTGRDLQVDGLPATFREFQRVLGAKTVAVEAGTVDTGDLLLVP